MSRIIKLENIADFNASAINKHDSFSEINYLDTGSITRNVIDSYQNLKVGIDGIPSRAKRKVKDKTIIYSTVRPNQEHFGFMVNPLDNLIVSTGFCTIDINDDGIDPKYIYYLITQPHITVYLHTIGMNSVSAYPSINPSDIANLNFQIPEFEEQQKIASVLSTLDGKIALNNQINATLEQMAKTLYDYWFVQFDFPDENGKPYKTSGGEMVYNETLKRDIPKGWEVKKLSEIANLKAGGDKPSEFSDIPTEDLTVPIFSNGIINDGLYGYTNSSTIKKPSITISARGTIGFSKIRMNPFVPIIRLISITPIEEFFLKYLEQFFKDMDFENSGSVQQQLTVPQIKDLAILLPSEKTLNKFHGITLNGLLQIENNNEQIIELTKLRDWLLPMLMNGQVTVK